MEFRKALVAFTLVFLAACSASKEPASSNLVDGSSQTVINTTPAPTPVPNAMVPGDYPQTISWGGMDRTYILHVPTGYDGSKALPLVMVFHGAGGNAKSMVKLTKMNDLADQENFIVAYPNGTGDPQLWNAGIFSDPPDPQDDVGFVRAMVTNLEAQLNVDNTRIYAAGFSNGGMMAHRLGAELADLLAGIAVVEGTIGSVQDDGSVLKISDPKGPMSVIIFHGKKDDHVLYDGGQGVRLNALSVADAVKFWTDADACTAAPREKTDPNGGASGQDYSGCTAGTEVALVTLTNGVHQWPTLENAGNFPATDAIWKFFSRHAKNK